MDLLLAGGYDWATWYLDDFITGDVDDVPSSVADEYFQFEHGVNAGQGTTFESQKYSMLT
jgi:hypothetical protein